MGKDPFDCEDRREKFTRNMEVVYTLPEGLSRKVRDLIERMLYPDHTKRFRTADELLNYMNELRDAV